MSQNAPERVIPAIDLLPHLGAIQGAAGLIEGMARRHRAHFEPTSESLALDIARRLRALEAFLETFMVRETDR